MAVAKKHVFLSYVRETSDDVKRLRDDLIASGETVWWDGDIPPGANWKLTIRKALKGAYAFILCLSREMEGRELSGAFPEIRDAIAVYRERSPLGTFIILVRLSECEVPSFEGRPRSGYGPKLPHSRESWLEAAIQATRRPSPQYRGNRLLQRST